ncbi:MAG: ribosome small subunit-dependent GTPase A [Melioribacteraceae bacterium]|nr:ribosome small subunit-dependent GTPase A [Melioribacteraceae bacterium]
MKGLVYKIESKDYYIFSEDGNKIRCSLRGKFQKEFNLKKDKLFEVDLVVVGDFVDYSLNNDGTGVIENIHERKNFISRKAPRIKGAGYRGERLEQKIAANIDNLIIVSSVQNPQLNNKTIDRFLITGESSNVNCVIVINKIDLDDDNNYKIFSNLYKQIGYSVIETSVKENLGINNLKEFLNGKISLVWGQSGVGKSSLLNSIYPNLNLKIGEISKSTNKGKHTTVTSILIKIDENTFVIDTPGIREIEPYGITKEDLGHYFIEFKKYLNDCRFNTCTHFHEPDCEVRKAVENGSISNERYQSYLNILETIEDDINF